VKSIFKAAPAGWNRSRLRYCVTGVKNGAWGSEPGGDERDIICVRVADFDWDHLQVKLDVPTMRSFPEVQFQKLRLRRGDILLEKSGGGEKTPVGRVVRFDHDEEAVTSNFVARVRPSTLIHSEYLIYVLAAFYQSRFAHQFIKQNTGIQNLDDNALFSNELWLPSRDTQKMIVDFLDRETARIDELIGKREQFLNLIEEKKAALSVRAINGSLLGTDTAGMEGWFGKLPKGWIVRRAKFLFRERPDRSEAGNEELLSVSHITGVTRRSDKDVNMFLAESMEDYKLVSRGDVVINTMWAWMGARLMASMLRSQEHSSRNTLTYYCVLDRSSQKSIAAPKVCGRRGCDYIQMHSSIYDSLFRPRRFNDRSSKN
jgi:type I restriction enzyme S subunit